jgi:hypothetical protein
VQQIQGELRGTGGKVGSGLARVGSAVRESGAKGRKLPSVMLVDGYNVLYREPRWVSLMELEPAFARAEMEKW